MADRTIGGDPRAGSAPSATPYAGTATAADPSARCLGYPPRYSHARAPASSRIHSRSRTIKSGRPNVNAPIFPLAVTPHLRPLESCEWDGQGLREVGAFALW